MKHPSFKTDLFLFFDTLYAIFSCDPITLYLPLIIVFDLYLLFDPRVNLIFTLISLVLSLALLGFMNKKVFKHFKK